MCRNKLIAGTIALIVAAAAIPSYAQPPNPPGDYNDNDRVDAADYIVYLKNLNTTNVIPNDTTSGWVMEDDLIVWRENFGATSSGAGQGGGVPEPSSIFLVSIPALFVPLMRRRRGLARRS
jgi:hypothetical protein